jgi:hypothetical protein
MLNLLLNKQPVQLPDDFSMTMNLKSPIFNDTGSYSYPFKIPNSPKNQFLIGFIHRIPGTGDPYSQFDSKFTWKDIPLFTGKGKFKIFNDKSFEGNILEGNGDWNYQMKNNYLQNYDFGSLTFDTEALALDWINGCKNTIYPEQPCAFPQIYNDLYYDPVAVESSLMNYNFYFPSDDLIHKVSTDGVRTPIVPMLYLRYVLVKLFKGMGFRLDDEFFTTHSDFNKLVVYNSVTCNGDPDLGDANFFPYYLTEILFNYHVPYCKVSDFITGIENMFNLRFFVNQTTRTIKLVPLSEVLSDTRYIDFSSGVISLSTELEEKQTGYKMSMELDSDDDAYAAQSAREDELLKLIKGSVVKMSELPVWPSASLMEIRYVFETDKYYQMQNKVWNEYTFALSGLMTKYLFKDASVQVDTKLSTLYMGGDSGLCNCKNKQANWRDISPRIFFSIYGSYGDQLMVMGYNYTPYYGALFYDIPFGSGSTAPGLFENHFYKWLVWRNTAKLVKAVRHMTFTELRDFDFSRKVMIDGTKYLVKSIQVNLKKDQIMPATLELYTC